MQIPVANHVPEVNAPTAAGLGGNDAPQPGARGPREIQSPYDSLVIDPAQVTSHICQVLSHQVRSVLRRRGAVVALSGGVDSSVVAALCARALGSENVLGVLMPERDSSPDALRLGTMVATALGVATIIEDIAPALTALGCYTRQIEAIREVFPEYAEGWRCKLTLPPILGDNRLNIHRLTVQSPDGPEQTARMPTDAYQALVAATNFKQRVRKTLEYYHADRLRYAVAGTPNRLEYDQGFFVKHGDGDADIKPIAHLYKSQVYALATYLGIPHEITSSTPTTDTYSLPQTQEEFYFSIDLRRMDACLYGYNHALAAVDVAPLLALSPEQVDRVYRDIAAKRRGSSYLHQRPMLIDPVEEV